MHCQLTRWAAVWAALFSELVSYRQCLLLAVTSHGAVAVGGVSTIVNSVRDYAPIAVGLQLTVNSG